MEGTGWKPQAPHGVRVSRSQMSLQQQQCGVSHGLAHMAWLSMPLPNRHAWFSGLGWGGHMPLCVCVRACYPGDASGEPGTHHKLLTDS